MVPMNLRADCDHPGKDSSEHLTSLLGPNCGRHTESWPVVALAFLWLGVLMTLSGPNSEAQEHVKQAGLSVVTVTLPAPVPW